MAWETRERGGLYYTKSNRVNGRVVREYVGCSWAAQYIAWCDQREREERELDRLDWRCEREQAECLEQAVAAMGKAAKRVTEKTLLSKGFHKHKGEWRRRRTTMIGIDELEQRKDSITKVLDDAHHGREGSREALQELLEEKDVGLFLTIAFGDAARKTEQLLLSRVAGGDVVVEETTKAALARLRDDLAEPDDSELEQLLVRRATLCWLALNDAESRRVKRWQYDIDVEVADFWDRHLGRLNSEFLKACHELANVRRLLRRRRRSP